MTTIEFEPGNGTRYEVTTIEIGEKTVIIWWLNGAGGQAMRFVGDDVPHPSYVSEKLRINEVDAIHVCEAARRMLSATRSKAARLREVTA
jgi:hypothetical protein